VTTGQRSAARCTGTSVVASIYGLSERQGRHRFRWPSESTRLPGTRPGQRASDREERINVLMPRPRQISVAEAATRAYGGLEGSHGEPWGRRPRGLYGRGDIRECPVMAAGGIGAASSRWPAHNSAGLPPVPCRTASIDVARVRLVGSAAYALGRQAIAYSGGRC
jgi:hypothetical protein